MENNAETQPKKNDSFAARSIELNYVAGFSVFVVLRSSHFLFLFFFH